jgi:peptidoglycan/LPS O-acetylase OafA/YrhL
MPPTAKIRIDRYNNFDFLRVLFAMSVIISHSYPLYGLPDTDWLSATTRTVSFSNLGLGGFFCISGFLVFQSAQRSPGYGNFIWKRILRIFPGLIVCVLLIALVLGAIVAGSMAYYRDSSVYTYIVKNIGLYQLQFCIEGVFEKNPYSCSINGSLWTLCYEFSFYLLFFVFFIKRNINKYISWLLLPLFLLLMYARWKKPGWDYWIPHTGMQAGQLVHFGLWFVAGMLLAVTAHSWMRHRAALAACSFALMLGIFTTKMPGLALYIIWPVFVLSFGSCKAPLISRLDKIGDPSYGTYIYGFVVQQTLIYYLYPGLGFFAFMGLSLLLALVVGYLSWYGIEKKALRWKKKAGPWGS